LAASNEKHFSNLTTIEVAVALDVVVVGDIAYLSATALEVLIGGGTAYLSTTS
jgi:hypothetical protein